MEAKISGCTQMNDESEYVDCLEDSQKHRILEG
jgi:hypothetical protein